MGDENLIPWDWGNVEIGLARWQSWLKERNKRIISLYGNQDKNKDPLWEIENKLVQNQ